MQTPNDIPTLVSSQSLRTMGQNFRSSMGEGSLVKLQAVLDTLDLTDINPRIARICYRMAVVLQTQCKYREAINSLIISLTQYRSLGNYKTDAARVLNQLATAHLAQGNLGYANSYLEQALEELEGNQTSLELADTHHYFGLLRQAQNNYVEAEEHLNQASSLYQILGKQERNVANVNIQLGQVYAAQNEHMRAQQAYKDALLILGEDSQALDVADIFHRKGVLFLAQNDTLQAAASLNKALTLYRAHNESNAHALQIGMLLIKLGQVQQVQHNSAFAISSYQQALETFATLSSEPRLEVASIYRSLAELYVLDNRPDLAETSLSQALQMYQWLYAEDPEHHDIISTRALLNQMQPHTQAPVGDPSSREKRRSWCCFRFSGCSVSLSEEKNQATDNLLTTPLI